MNGKKPREWGRFGCALGTAGRAECGARNGRHFHKFRMWKAFYYWKKHINRTKAQKNGKILEENLYILNPYLRGSLIALRNYCYDASKWTLFKVDPKVAKFSPKVAKVSPKVAPKVAIFATKFAKKVAKVYSKVAKK